MKTILHWLVLSGTVYVIAMVFPQVSVSPWWVALLAGGLLFFINVIIKPIIKILTLPINLITFGLFSFALNAFFFWLPSQFIDGFNVTTIKAAIIGAIIVSVVNWLFDNLTGK